LGGAPRFFVSFLGRAKKESRLPLQTYKPGIYAMSYFSARLIAYLTHPLLMLTYMLWMLLWINPYLFGILEWNDPNAHILLLRVFISSCFIPGIAVLMLRFTGLLSSIEMPEKQDRIAPFIITGLFYIWLFRNFLDNTQIPVLFSSFTLGATIALFLAFFVNIFSKISLHALGMGGLLGALGILTTRYPDYFFHRAGVPGKEYLLAAGLIVAGLTGSSRLFLGAHKPADVWGGYLIGLVAQLLAARFLLMP